MKVYPDKKLLVIEYRADIEHVLQNTKRFATGTKDQQFWLAVPHTTESVRVLRNLGVQAPSPIGYYYNWAGGKPFDSQRVTADLCTIARRAYVLSEMGVGKTRAVLFAYDYLRSIGEAHKLLVASPLSTLSTVWENEVFENFPHLKVKVLYGDKRKRQRLLSEQADIYVINHEGVEVVHADIFARGDIDAVIIDELASYRNSRSVRWKNLEPIVRRSSFAWGLTGSPTPNRPTDAYGQSKLLTPKLAGYSFKAFQDRTMRQVSNFTWVDRQEALDVVHSIMQPAVRFTRDQCFDLPPTTYSTLQVQLSKESASAYKEMFNYLATQVRTHQITAANEGVKLSKLLQISAGFAYDEASVGRYIGGVDRFREIINVIENASGKVIIFAPFRYFVQVLGGVLKQRYDTAIIHGGVSKAQRTQIFSDFQKSSNLRILVAHPKTMAHGLTLTAANTIVWASPTTSPEIYQQANARITRSGQGQNTFIIHMAATKAERHVYSRLSKRGAMQGALLELFEDQSL